MLKGISPRLNSDMLWLLNNMGHGDMVLICDAHYPATSANDNVVQATGNNLDDLIEAILPLFELDNYVESSAYMMIPAKGDALDPVLTQKCKDLLAPSLPKGQEIKFVERFEFYEMGRNAFGIIASSDIRKYANIILTKGVTPII
ncbi:MAG: RbsD/FucU family protein [Alphaproteobacteria bacterium]